MLPTKLWSCDMAVNQLLSEKTDWQLTCLNFVSCTMFQRPVASAYQAEEQAVEAASNLGICYVGLIAGHVGISLIMCWGL